MQKTIYYRDHEVQVYFEYHPAEPAQLYDKNGLGYPGCHAFIQILGVKLEEVELIPFLREAVEGWEEDIEALLWNELAND